VAQYLRDFLERAGAIVTLTRDQDIDISLAKRAQIANENSDLFLSIHHNASSNPTRNYTSVWYHADLEHRPAAIDLGRHILAEAIDQLGLSPTPLLSTGLLSDHLIYPGKGFGVLRHLKIPGVLSEGSFHSNPEEEKRLADPTYNEHEAWGLFRGMVSYVASGQPHVTLESVDPNEIVFSVDDGLVGRGGWGTKNLRIFTSLTRVEFQNTEGAWIPAPFTFDSKADRITCKLQTETSHSPKRVRVTVVNLNKNHNYPRIFEFHQ
jgi:hypothetical protein